MMYKKFILLFLIASIAPAFGMKKRPNRNEYEEINKEIKDKKNVQDIMLLDCWGIVLSYLKDFELITIISLVNKSFFKTVLWFYSNRLNTSRSLTMKFNKQFLERKKRAAEFMQKYAQKIIDKGGQVKLTLDETEFQPIKKKKNKKPVSITIDNMNAFNQAIKTLGSINSRYRSMQTKANCYGLLEKLLEKTCDVWCDKCLICCKNCIDCGEELCNGCDTCCEKTVDSGKTPCCETCCDKLGDCCTSSPCQCTLISASACGGATTVATYVGALLFSILGLLLSHNPHIQDIASWMACVTIPPAVVAGTLGVVALVLCFGLGICSLFCPLCCLGIKLCQPCYQHRIVPLCEKICFYCCSHPSEVKETLRTKFTKKLYNTFNEFGGDEDFKQQSLV